MDNLCTKIPDYIIEVVDSFCAIISPCCSIENNLLTVAPLLKIDAKLIQNQYFVDDFTIINSELTSEEAAGPHVWNNVFSQEERDEKTREGEKYTRIENFIYDKHPLLPEYKLSYSKKDVLTGCYMIDFRLIFSIKSSRIIRGNKDLMQHKVLELSVETRSELREKLLYYFKRNPDEEAAVGI
jgi:hypothetical protein